MAPLMLFSTLTGLFIIQSNVSYVTDSDDFLGGEGWTVSIFTPATVMSLESQERPLGSRQFLFFSGRTGSQHALQQG